MRRGTRRIAPPIAAVVLLALLACVPGVASAKAKHRIDVRPGHDALSNALDRAGNGDVLRIHGGRYREAFSIERPVRLVGVGDRRPVIDARCADRGTIQVHADRVKLRRLKVIGADSANEIDFSAVSEGRVNDVVVKDTCDAEYGVNVFATGSLSITGSRARGFGDAGFYIGEITATPGGFVRLAGSESYDNNRGVIVENSAGGDIRVTGNDLHDNDLPGFGGPVGILVNNSDGVLIEGNQVRDNGAFGLQLTPNSDGNVVIANTLLGNPVDVLDQGSGNCGSQNTFAAGDRLPPC